MKFAILMCLCLGCSANIKTAKMRQLSDSTASDEQPPRTTRLYFHYEEKKDPVYTTPPNHFPFMVAKPKKLK